MLTLLDTAGRFINHEETFRRTEYRLWQEVHFAYVDVSLNLGYCTFEKEKGRWMCKFAARHLARWKHQRVNAWGHASVIKYYRGVCCNYRVVGLFLQTHLALAARVMCMNSPPGDTRMVSSPPAVYHAKNWVVFFSTHLSEMNSKDGRGRIKFHN